ALVPDLPEAADTLPEAEKNAAPRILLVEDNAVAQRFMTTLLERRGYAVMLAPDGLSALRKAATGRFDLILMDLQMPGLDGLEVTRKLRAASALHQPRVIAVTANVFNEDRQACEAAGMQGFLGKPFRLEALARLLGLDREGSGLT
ncbi:MAG: response regulator, partial [Burkholderiales bacterium]